MLHNPSRITHKEGTFSRESTLLNKANGDAHCKSQSNARSNDIELQRRNSGAESTSSGDMLLPAVTLPINHLTNEQQAHAKGPAQSTLANVKLLPTIESSEDNSSRGSVASSERGTIQTTAQSSICTNNRLTPVELPNNNNSSSTDAAAAASGHVTPPATNQNNAFSANSQGNLPRRSSVNIGSKTILEDKENGHVPKETEDSASQGGEEEEEEEKTIQMCPCFPCCCPVRTWPPDSSEARENGGALNWLKLVIRWILFVPAFPFVCIFSWTIPDCSKDELKKWYIVSFLMSGLWIAILSFGMVTLVGRAGCILNVDTYIMGLVVIAVGTSIPDALSSVLVARDGYGDMAVSNAIGSNVFDINLGLGLPFIIRIAIDVGEPIDLLVGEEWAHFYSGHMPIIPHAKFGFILLIILAIALTIFAVNKFNLTKWIGISFVSMYVLFLIYAFLQELYCVRKKGIYC